ncbi:MAG: S41 family peptidase, partial [Planctomycetota bacterium]
MDETVGYVRIERFEDVDASAGAIDAALADLDDVKGLVIDLRHNGGGDDRVGQVIGSRLVTKPRPYMTVAVRRFGRSPMQFFKPVTWRLKPAGPTQFTGPIVVLINDRSISAAENMTLAMRSIPHAVLMGETTAGVMADSVPEQLPNGWRVSIPVNLFRDMDGVCWEGIGIVPDYWVKNTKDEVASGTDRQLQTALEFIGRLNAGGAKPRTRIVDTRKGN